MSDPEPYGEQSTTLDVDTEAPFEDWDAEWLAGRTTAELYRDPSTGAWILARADLHEAIIARLLAGFAPQPQPEIIAVMGGEGAGKSRLIRTKLAPEHPEAVVIDADEMWRLIPEYDTLAETNWRMAANLTYAEVRYLRDAALAEATARRLNIIWESPGDEDSFEVATFLKAEGYRVAVSAITCSPDTAWERVQHRADTNPTPEDNLWGSGRDPAYPDKYDYQTLDGATFMREYSRRRP